jgi:alkylated DNA repair dioxygenase AlkB
VIDLSRAIPVVDGITLYPDALADADDWFARLRDELALRQEFLQFFGRDVPMPRLTAWYGDAGATYTYSRLRNEPMAWMPSLKRLREALNASLALALNSCLANWYRDGNDSMGWHADRERELRDSIVSISLGASRTFQLREGLKGKALSTKLQHGSILLMTVASQHRYSHRVPREHCTGERLNLTFRRVKGTVV